MNDLTLSKYINKVINDNEKITKNSFQEISNDLSEKEFNDFNNSLNNFEKELILPPDIPKEYKPLIVNMIKTFMIQQKRIDVGNDNIEIMFEQFKQMVSNKDVIINQLKEYIIEITKIAKNNKIEIPTFKTLELQLVKTNIKGDKAIHKRMKALESNENTPELVNEWMNKLKAGKIEIVPNDILKAGAKAQNEKITIRKNETNSVMKK